MERNKMIDNSKAIGILLVVLGHTTGVPIPIKKIIYSFHMPLFFIISGYFYNKVKYDTFGFVQFTKAKFKNYIVPYFKITLICYIVFSIILPLYKEGFSDVYIKQLLKYFVGILYSRGTMEWMPNCSPLWFLTCLFVSEIIFFLINKHIKRPVIVFVICGILGYILSITLHVKLPWNIDTALTAVNFMYIGYILKKFDIINKLKAVYLVVFIGVFLASIKYNNYIVNFDNNKYGNILLMYLAAISGSLIIMYLCTFIKNVKILSFLGKNTLVIMGFNYAAIFLVAKILSLVHILNNFIVNYLIQILILSLLVIIIEKIYPLNKFFMIIRYQQKNQSN